MYSICILWMNVTWLQELGHCGGGMVKHFCAYFWTLPLAWRWKFQLNTVCRSLELVLYSALILDSTCWLHVWVPRQNFYSPTICLFYKEWSIVKLYATPGIFRKKFLCYLNEKTNWQKSIHESNIKNLACKLGNWMIRI